MHLVAGAHAQGDTAGIDGPQVIERNLFLPGPVEQPLADRRRTIPAQSKASR